MKIIFIFLLLINVFFETFGQFGEDSLWSDRTITGFDSLGKEITTSQFDSLVTYYTTTPQSLDSISFSHCVEIIRVANTIESLLIFKPTIKKKVYTKFLKLYYKKFESAIIKILLRPLPNGERILHSWPHYMKYLSVYRIASPQYINSTMKKVLKKSPFRKKNKTILIIMYPNFREPTIELYLFGGMLYKENFYKLL